MVQQWGMSEKVGSVCLDESGGSPQFMGMGMLQGRTVWGDKINDVVEDEIERLVNNSYMTAKSILLENRELFEHLTQTLMETEVVSAEELKMMLVNFKAQAIDYKLIGGDKNREVLPFKALPDIM
jgi:cell division protease FtsH